jgi:hypothetical protein
MMIWSELLPLLLYILRCCLSQRRSKINSISILYINSNYVLLGFQISFFLDIISRSPFSSGTVQYSENLAFMNDCKCFTVTNSSLIDSCFSGFPEPSGRRSGQYDKRPVFRRISNSLRSESVLSILRDTLSRSFRAGTIRSAVVILTQLIRFF